MLIWGYLLGIVMIYKWDDYKCYIEFYCKYWNSCMFCDKKLFEIRNVMLWIGYDKKVYEIIY